MIRAITSDKPLKILGFTDQHMDDYADRLETTQKLMAETIQQEKPDLVVFVGDNITGGDNRARAERFQELMTELQVPWAPVFGNHEGDNPASVLRSEMAEIFRKSPYCMIPEKKPVLADGTEVFGETNYVIELKNEAGEIVHKLIFLDCGPDSNPEELAKYGIITEKKNPDGFLKTSQIEWYKEQVKDDNCDSIIFCHIALHEHREACEMGELIEGENHEGVCTSPYNSGMFAAIEEAGKTKMFVVGHDHTNVAKYLYKGVLWIYNRMGGMSSYNIVSKKKSDKLMQGCSIYYVDAQGKVTFGDIIYHDYFPQHLEEMYRVVRKD